MVVTGCGKTNAPNPIRHVFAFRIVPEIFPACCFDRFVSFVVCHETARHGVPQRSEVMACMWWRRAAAAAPAKKQAGPRHVMSPQWLLTEWMEI